MIHRESAMTLPRKASHETPYTTNYIHHLSDAALTMLCLYVTGLKGDSVNLH